MRFDAVIWDLDGTLLDTLEDLAASVNAAMAAFGYPARSLDEVRRMVGNGVSNLVLRALPEGRKEDHAAALAVFRAHYAEHYADATRPYPGIIEALDALCARGVAMAVVSNKLDAVTKALCRLHFGGRIGVVIGDRPGLPRKPAPDSVRLALAQLRPAPSTSATARWISPRPAMRACPASAWAGASVRRRCCWTRAPGRSFPTPEL